MPDLGGLILHPLLGDQHAQSVDDRAEQVHPGHPAAFRAAGLLPVDRDSLLAGLVGGLDPHRRVEERVSRSEPDTAVRVGLA